MNDHDEYVYDLTGFLYQFPADPHRHRDIGLEADADYEAVTSLPSVDSLDADAGGDASPGQIVIDEQTAMGST